MALRPDTVGLGKPVHAEGKAFERRRERTRRALRAALALAALLFAGAAAADAPRVVADIAPVHSLVARVMQGVGEPTLLLRGSASPHGHALRPSQARALEAADLVVWTAASLTPWLPGAVATLAPAASSLELIGLEGTRRLAARGRASSATEDVLRHGSGDGGERAEVTDAEHDHGTLDPHAWLDPLNARVWLAAIAAELARLDPANAERYRANAGDGQIAIDALVARTERLLAPLRDRPFVVFHDAFAYFEARFGLDAGLAIVGADGAAPGPARLAALRERIRAAGIRCAFAEPQFDARLLVAATEGSDARRARLDPIGADLEPGPSLYPALIDALGESVADCLG